MRSRILAVLALALLWPAAKAHAQHYHVLYEFTGAADGSYPAGDLLLDSHSLYGVTMNGGSGFGSAFAINLQTSQEMTLHTFAGPPSDGASPAAGLIRGSDGNFYGTTREGGANNLGTIFRMDSSGGVTVLHSFATADGTNPTASLVEDPAGNLYGTTSQGGADSGGTIFKLDPSGNYTDLHNFKDTAGWHPAAGLVLIQGDLYGTTSAGGVHRGGVLFRFRLASGKLKLLYSFAIDNGPGGANPYGKLIPDGNGNLYGTTKSGGGQGTGRGCGVIFSINTTTFAETVLHAFSGADGCHPYAGVVRDGDLYGTTYSGGPGNAGAIFQLANGNLNLLHGFAFQASGGSITSSLTRYSRHRLYGTSPIGGPVSGCNHKGCGVVFEITP